jgi:hypothetical protein
VIHSPEGLAYGYNPPEEFVTPQSDVAQSLSRKDSY